jgi:signal transduction histidine kinase
MMATRRGSFGSSLIGFAKLLGAQQKRRHQDGQIVEYADLIRDAATHLLAVINDILDISKLQSGKYTVDSKEVDLDEVLQLSLAALKPAARRPRHLDWRASPMRHCRGCGAISRLPAAASPSPPKPWRTAG